MKLTDLTNPEVLETLIGPATVAGLSQRSPDIVSKLQLQLNAMVESGDLKGYENGLAFVVAVRDALKQMPSLSTKPSDNDALNMATCLIDLKLKFDRPAQAAGTQRGA